MNSPLERVPSLIWGQPWSSRLPWRWHEQADQFALSHAYARKAAPSWTFTSEAADATLVFAGDLALHRLSPDDSVERIFGGVRDAFDSADFTCVNLETVLTEHDTPSGANGRFLKASPESLRALEYLGTDAACVANNHALDFGSAGFSESVDRLRSAGVASCGVDVKEPATGIAGATIHVVNGVRVGMVAATDHFGGIREHGVRAPVWFDPDAMRNAVHALGKSCDIVVVQLHWGYEYVMYPLQWHRDYARRLVDAGAHIVCCHHAHVVMGVEQWNGGMIAHGLGNFWFGTKGKAHPASRFGICLRAAVNARGIVSAAVIPIGTDADLSVRIDDKCAPGFHRLCSNLQVDSIVSAVESSRVRHELAAWLLDVTERIRQRDVDGLFERQNQLHAPRNTWLLTNGVDRADHECGNIATWLRAFRDTPEEMVVGNRLQTAPRIERFARITDARSLAGRWP